ncbi:MAG: lipoate--protein ligase family protein [Proteobacteria bacterium]|nr:lipoate--protein ligase family protein [Pseudomonadota bacterium]
MNKWRLILSPPLDGAENMAIDEAIFRHSTTPTLRIYSWKSPTLSLGYFQKADKGLIARCTSNSVDIVRRPTGGRAVLHHCEFTYSVIANYRDFPPPTTLSGIYLTLAGWQVDALNLLGIGASLGEKRSARAYSKLNSCFNSGTPYEINAGGKKISGSAQRRDKERFIQHGSILMDVDRSIYTSLMGDDMENGGDFTTMKDEGYSGTYEKFVSAMIKGFESTVGASLKEAGLSALEKELVKDLKASCAIF